MEKEELREMEEELLQAIPQIEELRQEIYVIVVLLKATNIMR